MTSQTLIAFTAVLALCASARLEAQPADSLATGSRGGIIDTILIAGNERTKDYVILDEMTLKPGMTATPRAMEYDRNRIYSLGLFTSVDVYYDSLQGIHFLFVQVSERWYIIPFPEIGFRDGDPKKPYYGGGFLDYNFRGRNQKLYGSVAFGYDPSFALSFSDPLLIREERLYFGTGLSTSRVRNRSARESALTGDFDERHYDVNATIGKRLSLYENLGINLGFHIVEIGSYRPGRTASPQGVDRYLYATADYSFDSRDLREYAMDGSFYSVYLTKYGFGESHVNFARFGFDVRRYTPLPFEFSLATRAFGSLVAGGLVAAYARAYLGYGDRVRGYYSDVFEGDNVAGGSVELRFPLLKARTIVFRAIPIPQEFAVWRFGISLELFADAGTAWFRNDRVPLSSFSTGYGGGIAFLLPYSIVVRTEYAFNKGRKGQFIFNFQRPF